jgi:c-di-GMP-binding flagellar brake protein YcgR
MGFLRDIFGKKETVIEPGRKQQAPIVERRKFPRFVINENTFIYPVNKPPIQATIIDICQGGVKLELRESLQPGSKVELALYSGGLVVKAIIIIKWDLQKAAGHVCGAEFISTDPKQRAFIMQYIKTVVK